MALDHSDYIVYVDESGDHSLTSINRDYPVFTLAFCLFHKQTYIDTVVPAVLNLKFKWFGHDNVILRSYDIKNNKGSFDFLKDKDKKSEFMGDVEKLIDTAEFQIIAAVIDKERLIKRYATPSNPYDIALQFCLERTHRHLQSLQQHDKTTFVLLEGRGKNEDRALLSTFHRVINGANYMHTNLCLKPSMSLKQHNSSGLQFADLVANPIGRAIFNPKQTNRAYETIEKKFRKSPEGHATGWGLKTFP